MIPEKLKKGDYIGVIAPSNCIETDDLEYINASIALMESSGFKIKFGNFVFENTLKYGTDPVKRAKDINLMFKDPEVKAIMCVKGGEDSNSCFDYIDFEIIKNNTKIICGFSDNTSILDVINDKTGLVTFHGPTFKSLTSWGTITAYEQFMKTFVKNANEIGDREDEYKTIQDGEAEGLLVGGNLSLVTKLVCGKYKINIKNKILFLEELGFESMPELVNSNIYYLKQNGVFDEIAGLWIGNYEHPSKISLEEIIMNVLKDDYKFPIIKSDNFGHIDKKTVIPIGARAKIDTTKDVKIELVENILL